MSFIAEGQHTVGIPTSAKGVAYDNTNTELTSTNVNDVIDELNAKSVTFTTDESTEDVNDPYVAKSEFDNSVSALKENLTSETLLWTNSDITSNFTSQSLSINTSDYSKLKFICLAVKNNLDILLEYELSINNGIMGVWVSGPSIRARYIRWVSTESVSFENSVYWHSTGGDGTDNQWIIPYKIYGIKHV